MTGKGITETLIAGLELVRRSRAHARAAALSGRLHLSIDLESSRERGRRVSAIVADTSEWVEYFAGRPAAGLDHGLAAGFVLVPPMVAAELLSGARSPADRHALEDLLRDLAMPCQPFEHWVRVGALRAALRAQGLNVSTPDAHVAQCALDQDAILLTRDAIFTKMARLTPLRLAL